MVFLSLVEKAQIYTSVTDTGKLSIPIVKSGEVQSVKVPPKHRIVVTSHCQSPGGLELLDETELGSQGSPLL